MAIEQAIMYDASGVKILTDSKFMIDCVQKWMKNWKRNGWKLASGEPVKNKDDLVQLDLNCSKIPVTWVLFFLDVFIQLKLFYYMHYYFYFIFFV